MAGTFNTTFVTEIISKLQDHGNLRKMPFDGQTINLRFNPKNSKIKLTLSKKFQFQ